MRYSFSELRYAGVISALLYSAIVASLSPQDMQSSNETVLAASAQPAQLSDKPVRVKLASKGSSEQVLESLSASRHVYLVLTGLSAVEQPGTLFHLYLDLPEGVAPSPDNEWHIGSINFFNAVPVPDAPKDKPGLPVSIDITGAARKLRSAHKLTSDTTITIMATRPPEAGSNPVIGHIALVTR